MLNGLVCLVLRSMNMHMFLSELHLLYKLPVKCNENNLSILKHYPEGGGSYTEGMWC